MLSEEQLKIRQSGKDWNKRQKQKCVKFKTAELSAQEIIDSCDKIEKGGKKIKCQLFKI